jgi:hypothetical protein
MIPKVIDAKYVRDFVIHLRFADGVEGDVNLQNELEGEIFTPLKDASCFRQFTVNKDFCTLSWPNGADFAPEFLYSKLRITA